MPASYDFVILRPSNVKLVSEQTGMTVADLKKLLKRNRAKNIFEVKIPLNVKLFTREEK